MTNTRLFTLIILIALLPLRLIAAIDMQAHVGSDEGKDAYNDYQAKQTDYYTSTYTYASLIALKNDELFGRINTLMGNTAFTTGRSFSYSNLSTNYGPVDTDLNNKNNIILFYNGASVSSTWDSGNTFNKEHVWPQSFGASESRPMGYDMQAVRPCNPSINSSRSNQGYAETIDNAYTYIPDASYRGDCARIIMYDYLTYGKAGNYYNKYYKEGEADLFNEFGTSDKKIFESLHVMLKWHMQDPPSLTEMVRNDGAQDYQGNRNPLIDYPELAIQVFLDDGITTYTVTENSDATMWPAHRYTLSDGFIAYLTNNDGSHPESVTVEGASYSYDPILGRLTISNVTKNMIIDAAGTGSGSTPDPNTHTVTWMANGEVSSTQEYSLNAPITLPADPTPCDGWTFVGWTAEENYQHPFCLPELISVGSVNVTSDATYYAVFKKQ